MTERPEQPRTVEVPGDELPDPQWTPQARHELTAAADTAARAVQDYASWLGGCTSEEGFDPQEAMARAEQLRAALLAFDDAGFDYSGFFPVCLPDEELDPDELDEDEDDEIDELDLDEPAATTGPSFVTLVARCDYRITDPDNDLQEVVESLMGKDLVPIAGLEEVRKAVVHIPLDELESDEDFDEDPFGLMLDD
ncbi:MULTISPECIES: hypothetical protein [unclassified Luteococcus]|uniref:hypothetical protein n=1 Tax=unclassified Luteococcus TaxID=2639923 RepID=UPI00313EB584